MERTINRTSESGTPAAKTGPETPQTTPAPAQKLRRPYEKLSMKPILLDQECAILQGSVTSNEVAVRDEVRVTALGEDDTWSDRLDVDFEL